MQHFLAAEGQTAASVGYDRPSHKFLQFIRKHYGERTYASCCCAQRLLVACMEMVTISICILSAGLAQYIPQSNNFVVFSSYFHNAASPDPAGSIWVGHACCYMAVKQNMQLLANTLSASPACHGSLIFCFSLHGTCCAAVASEAAFAANRRMLC